MKHFIVVLFFVLLSPSAYACSCPDPGPACQANGNPHVKAVFAARVEHIARGQSENVVTMQAAESFRGDVGGTVTVLTPSGGASCGYDFKEGQDYLVWAYTAGDTPELRVDSCTRTLPLQQASADIQYLRSVSYRNETSWIYGDAMMYTFDPDFRRDPEAPRPDPNLAPEEARRLWEAADRPMKPMTGSSVVAVDANGRIYQSVLDAEGQYRIEGLPPGKYTVRLDAQRTMLIWPEQQEFDLKPGGCGHVDFRAQIDGRITGVITDAYDSPNLLEVQLGDPNPEKTERFFQTQTDKDGRFEFKGLPAGEYVLLVNRRLYTPCNRAVCPDLTFYPGVRKQKDATVIKLGEAQKLTGVNLKLLPPREPDR